MFKKRLMEELRGVIMQIPWEERRDTTMSSCFRLTEELLPDDEVLTTAHIHQLRQLVVPVVRESAPEGLYHARWDLERAVTAAIQRACSGQVILDQSGSRLPFMARVKALIAEIRRSATRA